MKTLTPKEKADRRLAKASETAYNKAWAALPPLVKPKYPPKWINLSNSQKAAVTAAVAKARRLGANRVETVLRMLPLFNVSLLEVTYTSDAAELVENYLLPYSRRREISQPINNLKLNPYR